MGNDGANIAEKIALKITEEFIKDRITSLKEQRKQPGFVMEANYFTNLSERSMDLFDKTKKAAYSRYNVINQKEQVIDNYGSNLEKNIAQYDERKNLEDAKTKLEYKDVSINQAPEYTDVNPHQKLEYKDVNQSQEQVTRDFFAKYDNVNLRNEQGAKDTFAMFDELEHPKLR